MKSHGLYWGIGLIALGVLLILDTLGLLPFDLSGLILPLLLILAGIWVIWGLARPRPATAATPLRVPLDGADTLKLKVRHGAGRLRIDSSGDDPSLLTAEFGVSAHSDVERQGQSLAVRLRPADDWFFLSAPWSWQRGALPDWSIHLPTACSVELDLQTGASEAAVDLAGIRLAGLRFETGASSTEIELPMPQGSVPVRLKGGAGAIRLTLSPKAEARVTPRADLGTITLEPNHFTRQGPDHLTANFAHSDNRYEIDVSVVAGSVDVSRRTS